MATIPQPISRANRDARDVLLSMDRSRLLHLDAARGLAALTVVLFHAASALVPGFHALTDTVLNLGSLATTVFFVLSGIVIPASRARSDARSFAVRRLLRVWPLAALTILVSTCLPLWGVYQAALPAGTMAPPLAPTLLANLTLLAGVLGYPYITGVLWTLQTDVIWYAVCTPFRRMPNALPIALAVLALLVPSLLTVTLAMCAVGAARVRWPVLALTALACVRMDGTHGALAGQLAGLALIPLLFRHWHAPRGAVWLGTISYPLYLTHMMVIAAAPILWPLAIPLAWLVHRGIERPLMRHASLHETSRIFGL